MIALGGRSYPHARHVQFVAEVIDYAGGVRVWASLSPGGSPGDPFRAAAIRDAVVECSVSDAIQLRDALDRVLPSRRGTTAGALPPPAVDLRGPAPMESHFPAIPSAVGTIGIVSCKTPFWLAGDVENVEVVDAHRGFASGNGLVVVGRTPGFGGDHDVAVLGLDVSFEEDR